MSQANTLELYRPPVISDETKSYSTYERHSLADDYHDDYRAYDPNDLVRMMNDLWSFSISVIC